MELRVSRGILQSFASKLDKNLDLDAAIVGAGPSGLIAAAALAAAGKKTAVFENKNSPGGGMWGGAMMFNQIIVQNEAMDILKEAGIKAEKYGDNLLAVDSVHATAALVYGATAQGACVFNNVRAEDVILKNGRVNGLVINWGPVVREGLHIDPLMIRSKVVLDGTGHPSEICSLLAAKNKIKLNTVHGGVVGEMSLDVALGEQKTIENTKEVYPGLYVCGMAANGVYGSSRMGPIFGGMLMSGKKAAALILEELDG